MFKQSEEISEISKLINFTILFQLLIFPFPESLRNCFHFQLNANFNYVNVSIAYKPINEILSRSRVKNNLTIKIKKNIIRVPSMYIYRDRSKKDCLQITVFVFVRRGKEGEKSWDGERVHCRAKDYAASNPIDPPRPARTCVPKELIFGCRLP